MTLDEEARAALIAYTIAHVAWKDATDALLDPSCPELGTVKAEAKRLRGQLHSKLLGLGKLLLHTTEN